MKNTEYKKMISLAEKNIADIVGLAIEHDTEKNILVVYDLKSELSEILFSAYKNVFPDARFINFDDTESTEILKSFSEMVENDLVVLIQSTDFRLDKFRIRINLFQNGIRVVDHMHLSRNTPDQHETYINSLEYDPKWYRVVGHKLREKLSKTENLQIFCNDGDKKQKLEITNGLEEAKPNLGDYREMKNTGGTFPIGEVFTEAKELENVNGSLMIYAFADVNFNISMHEPFRIDIKNGLVVSWAENTPSEFIAVIEKIKNIERPIMREIGFGMNRAITREKYLNDITAFERILGMHISLGEKHTVYKKKGIVPKKSRFHVDIFLDVDSVMADDVEIFKNGRYLV